MSQISNFSIIIYAQLQGLCLVLVSYLLYATIRHNKRESRHINGFLPTIHIIYIAYFIEDFLSLYLSVKKPANIPLVTFLCVLIYLTGKVTPLLWMLFAETQTGGKIGTDKKLRLYVSIPTIIFCILIVSSPWTGWIFKLNEDGVYFRSALFYVGIFLDAVYYIGEAALSLHRYKNVPIKHEKRINVAYACYSIPVFVALVAQTFFNIQLRGIGTVIALALAYEAIVQATAKDHMHLVNGLTEDFSCVFLVDVDMDICRVVRITPEFVKRFGNESREVHYSEIVSENIRRHVPENDRAEVMKEFDADRVYSMLKTKNSYSITYRIERPDSVEIYNRAKFVKMDLGEGRFFLFGIKDDDAEIRSELYEVAENHAREDLVSVLAEDYRSLYLYNFSEDKIVVAEYRAKSDAWASSGKNISREIKDYKAFFDKMVHPEDRKLIMFLEDKYSLLKELASKKRKTVVFRQLIDGEYRYVELLVAKAEPVFEPPVNVALGFKEIDAVYREKIEQSKKLAEALEKADVASKAKSNFLFSISHDIRTPMNAIIGFTDIAKKNMDNSDKVADCLDKIQTSGQHLLNLINNVLDMSHIEAGKLQGEVKLIDIQEEGEAIVTICRGMAEDNDITFNFAKRDIKNRAVYADVLHLNQIMMNICSNAIKYTEPGGVVSFTIRELKNAEKGYAKFSFVVEDNGIGMSPEFLETVYDPFTRSRTATTSGIQGTGLGMAIVKHLVEYMGGTINIESRLGEGTTVSVVLSFKLKKRIKNSDENLNEEVSLAGRKVLVAEDNELNREIIEAILLEKEMQVEMVENGKEALDIIVDKGIDYYACVLMDIQMPVMDGYAATKEIRKLKDGEHLPIIALSANAFVEDKRKSLGAGMNAHIAKPINVGELMGAIRKSIKESKS